MDDWPQLQIRHTLPQRVRLQWSEAVSQSQVDQLCAALDAQSWVRNWTRRDSSRSLVLNLADGCPAVRWQLALASLGWQLQGDPVAEPLDRPIDVGAAAPSAWAAVFAQIGAGMVGSAAGQLLLGGLGAGLGMVWLGPRTALVLGGLGAVVGGIVGSTVATAWAEGRAADLRKDLGTMTLHRLSTRLGEQAGASSGRLLGTALAGPLGGVAGLALGSLLVGHLAADLTDPQAAHTAIGNRRWLAQIARQESRDAVTERVGQHLGRLLSGGSVVGEQLGGSLGVKFSHAIDWNASFAHHQLLPRLRHRHHSQTSA